MEILLKTMGQEKPVTSYRISDLEVAALDSDTFLKLPDVFIQKSIPVTHNIPKLKDVRKWYFFEEVDFTPLMLASGCQ